MAKQGRAAERPYTRMRRKVEEVYRRRRWLIVVVGFSLFVAVVSGANIVTQGSPWPQSIVAAALVAGLLIVIGAAGVLLFENMQPSDMEDVAVERGVSFLREQKYDERVIATIERRAERGSAAVQLRVTLPVLSLTLIATVSGLLSLIPPTWQPIGYGFLAMFVLTLLREVGRGNTDVVILSAIDEYRSEIVPVRNFQPSLDPSSAPQEPSVLPKPAREHKKHRSAPRPRQRS